MLSLSVRTVSSSAKRPHTCHFFQDNEYVFCCRTALNFVRRLQSDPDFPTPGLTCVSVIRIPDNAEDLVHKRRFRIGELLFHAVRYARTDTGKPASVAITAAPECVCAHLPKKITGSEVLHIDLRHTDPELLPESLRPLIPDGRSAIHGDQR